MNETAAQLELVIPVGDDERTAPSLSRDNVGHNAPELSAFPTQYQRLVDHGLMHFEASQAGFGERHSRGETSHTMHVWWARRPHSAMRALVFASLCKTTTNRTLELLTELVSSNVGEHSVLEECDRLLQKQYGRRPRILDTFGGGGTIPLEGVNVGADVSATDINELSVFIQKCHLEFVSPERAHQLITTIQACGRSILTRLRDETESLYPLRDRKVAEGTRPGPVTYLWSYSTQCPSCGYRMYLNKRPWLTRKNGKALRFSFVNQKEAQQVLIEDVATQPETERERRSSGVNCASCGNTFKSPSIKDCRDELMAMVVRNEGTGKQFLDAFPHALPNEDTVLKAEQKALNRLKCDAPKSLLPRWSGIVNPALYGMETHADFLNPRQRAVLLTLMAEISDQWNRARVDLTEQEAKFVLGTLCGLLDQIIDWNCRLSMWIPQNEQVGRAFCGPGVAMLWDYAEADPLLDGPANLWSKLDRIVAGIEALLMRRGTATVTLARAQMLPYTDNEFDAVVTDPPYYDNIYYNVLADFFYSWKRLLLRTIEPDLFSNDVTAGGGVHELVASSIRSGDQIKAHADYCDQLSLALKEISRVLKVDGLLSFVYAHASYGGWTALIHAFRASPLRISSAQPLSIERKARPRALSSEAVNTCITFVARKFDGPKPVRATSDLIRDFQGILVGGFAQGLESAGWRPEDAAMALFAQGVGLLAGVAEVAEQNDEEILVIFEAAVVEVYPSFKIKKRKSL